MRVEKKTAQSRREFIGSATRHGLLAVLAVAGALLARRSLSGQRCVNQGICSGCRAFPDCGLPQALSARQARTIAGKERT